MSNRRLAPSGPLCSRTATDIVQPRHDARQEPLPLAVLPSCVAVQLVFSLRHSIQRSRWGSSYTRYCGSIKPNFKLSQPTPCCPPARILKPKRGTLSLFCKHLSCVSNHTTTGIPSRLIGAMHALPLRSYNSQGSGVVLLSIVNQPECRHFFLRNNARRSSTCLPNRILHPSSNQFPLFPSRKYEKLEE